MASGWRAGWCCLPACLLARPLLSSLSSQPARQAAGGGGWLPLLKTRSLSCSPTLQQSTTLENEGRDAEPACLTPPMFQGGRCAFFFFFFFYCTLPESGCRRRRRNPAPSCSCTCALASLRGAGGFWERKKITGGGGGFCT